MAPATGSISRDVVKQSFSCSAVAISERDSQKAREGMERVTDMALKTKPFDAAEVLDTDEAVAEFVAAAFETEDPAFISKALGVVARARNMTALAKEIGMSRPALYRALSGESNPEFATIVKVLQALGLRMTTVVKPVVKGRKGSSRKAA
jgi:probable addiction module antidote protein